MSLCEGEFYGSYFFYAETSQVSSSSIDQDQEECFLDYTCVLYVDTAVRSILCSRLLVIGSLLGDKQLICMRNIRVFSEYLCFA